MRRKDTCQQSKRQNDGHIPIYAKWRKGEPIEGKRHLKIHLYLDFELITYALNDSARSRTENHIIYRQGKPRKEEKER